ncbi:MAG: hypothetical protein WD229_05940 [Pirellulales bacterium]
MSPEQLRILLHARPFLAFRIVMSSGQSYEIRHPEMALLTRNALFVAQSSNGADDMPEYAAVCAVLHIAAAEYIPADSR